MKISIFSKFLMYNQIDREALKLAVPHLVNIKYPKGTYIFHQGQYNEGFYGIIKGRISIRARKTYMESAMQKMVDKERAVNNKLLESNSSKQI